MNKASRFPAASHGHGPPANYGHDLSPSGKTGADRGAAPATIIPCDPSEGYGRHGRCIVCGHGRYSCACDMPDPEPEYFKPGINRDPDVWAGEDDGFVFVERIGPGRIAV